MTTDFLDQMIQETGPGELVDTKWIAQTFSVKEPWVRRYFATLRIHLEGRTIRYPKREVLQYLQNRIRRAA